MVFITSAIQRLDPTRLSRLMLVEVWNDQLGGEGYNGRPTPARFMGEVTIMLDLPFDQPVTKTERLRLEQNSDLVKRSVSGFITVRYEWTPNRKAISAQDLLHLHQPSGGVFELYGTLKLTLVSAERLINLEFAKKNGASSPYCMVLCYPVSPVSNELRPCVWRSPTAPHSLNPHWDATRSFEFAWSKPESSVRQQATAGMWNPQATTPTREQGTSEHSPSAVGEPCSGAQAMGTAPRLDEVLSALRELGAGLGQVRQEVRALGSRVDKLTARAGVPEPAAAQAGGQPGGSGPSQSASPRVEAARAEHPVLLPNWVPPPE
mmetsp:Transcript_14790/g.42397  ORF Transcript_14790/g.42397 Transcript_14790/m.42397 type:complete len:320 (+) Transcript_14790:2-961(+)